MIKVICICSKCKEEVAAYDNNDGTFIIDFAENNIKFPCPICGNINIMDFTAIQKLLHEKTSLPRIGTSRH